MYDRPSFIFDLASLVNCDSLWRTVHRATLLDFDAFWTPELERQLAGLSTPAVRALLGTAAKLPEAQWPSLQRPLVTGFDRLVHAGELAVRPGATDLLEQLADRKVPVAAISSMPPEQARLCVDHAGLRPLIHSIHTAHRRRSAIPTGSLHRTAIDDMCADRYISVAVQHDNFGLLSARAAGLFAVADPTVARPSCTNNHLERFWRIDVAAVLRAAALPRSA